MSGEQVTNSRLSQNSETILDTTIRSKKVDINVLLNKVRAERKKEKFENSIFFSLVVAAIIVTGVIVTL
mgnify:CR=1 FL=1